MLWVHSRDLAIAALPPEGHAFGDQPLAKSLSASAGFDQQQPQFSDVVGMPDEKYRADLGTIDVGDPAASREASNGLRNFAAISATRPSNEESKPYSPDVERAMALHHPSHVARPGAAQDRGRVNAGRRAAARSRPSLRSAVRCPPVAAWRASRDIVE